MNSYYAAAARARAFAWCTTRRSSALDVADGRFSAATRARRRRTEEIGGRAAGGRGRRVRVEPRVAARGVGQRGRQLHHPRHAVQHRPGPPAHARCRRRAGRRSARVPRDRRRRPRAEIRRRHRHPPRLASRSASSSTATPSASTTRARTSGRSATRSGAADRRAARSDRVFDRRRQGGRRVHAVGVSAEVARIHPRAGGAAGAASRAARGDRRRRSMPRSGPGTFDHAVLDDCRTEGLAPPKSHWAQRIDTPPFWGYPLRPGITFTYLGLRVDETARVVMTGGTPAATSSRPAKSWPATSCARATSPASA